MPNAAARLLREGHELELVNITSEEMDGNEASFQGLLEKLPGSTLVIIRLQGGVPYFKKFHRLLEAFPANLAALIHSEIADEAVEHRRRLPCSDEEYRKAMAYVKLGGEENEKGLLLWSLHRLGGLDIPVPPPQRPRTEGIYHPDHPRDVGLQTYLESLPGDRPTVGLMFYQDYWLSGNLAGVDGLIRALERQGMNVIPLFFMSSPDAVTGALGTKKTIERYLKHDGASRIDVLVMTMGFSQLRLSCPGDGSVESTGNFFQDLDVPVIQASFTYSSFQQWDESDQGIGTFEMSGNITWPEYDGQIISVPVACMEPTPEGSRSLECIPDRAEKVARICKAWSDLRRTPPEEKKIALLLYQNPPRRDAIGSSFGLDVPESLVTLLRSLQEAGYRLDRLPQYSREVVDELLAGLANDDDWLSAEEMKERAAASIPKERYQEWTRELVPESYAKMASQWGEAPGELFVSDGQLLVPGIRNGNVFIGIQPPRGMLEDEQGDFHSTEKVIPHNYLSYYRWLRREFGAHAVVHLGTHGTLEWLPGKSMGLSGRCYPDLVLDDLPNVYPYLMSNPGEGMQAKRRSTAVVVDHLPPAMARAGSYGELESLDADLQAYFQAEQAGQDGKMSALLDKVLNRLRQVSLLSDLGLPDDAPASEVRPLLKTLYDYLSEVRSAIIKDGLHVFGTVPEQGLLDETVYSLVRLRNGSIPSIREAVAESMGCDLGILLQSPSGIHPGDGRPNGAWLQEVEEECLRLVQEWRSLGFQTEACLNAAEDRHSGAAKLAEVCQHVCDSIIPGIEGTSMEVSNLLHALDGGYVPPGPSGVPTRGNSHLLPSGRNFYSIDPASIPTPASWELGRSMADKMVQRHVSENGRYPESVGMVVFATDTMKTGGDDIAYVLWLMGLRPVWSSGGGKVTGIEVIPMSELGRPRIDVTLRISGLFRDTFPHLMDLIDQGVEMVSSLDESPEKNYICKHLEEDIRRSLREGMGENEARSRAKVRVFGCPPGTYGGGVGEMIETSRWSEVSDLGNAFVNWGCHAYGGGRRGERMESLFQERLAGIDVTVKNHCSRELDMLDNDDDFVYHGGMVAAVRSQKGEPPASFVGDSSDPERLKLRSTAEECRFIFRSRVMNPKWLEGLMRHGYRGVQELASLVDYSFAWGATADIMEPWMYQTLADEFLLEERVQEWINDNNPYAMRHMTGRLLEAIDRSMWKPDAKTREQLESLYLDSDEFMESE